MALDFGEEFNDYLKLHTRICIRDLFTPTTPPLFYEHICKKKPIEEVLTKWRADRDFVERQNNSDIKNHLVKYPNPTIDHFRLFSKPEVEEDASISL